MIITTQTNKAKEEQQQLLKSRFCVDYLLEAASLEQARSMAIELCLEQTVELPGNLDAVHAVEDYIVGKIVEDSLQCLGRGGIYQVTIAYPDGTAGGELTQFLNVVFGNTSLKKGVSVENVTLSESLTRNQSMFPGPRFGIKGLREILKVPEAPLLCTALKPMGKNSAEFASMAYDLAKGGIDIIKDDHGLANQKWAPFEERVKLCAEAVQKANSESISDRVSLYCPCLNAPSDLFLERAHYAQKVGAGAVMVLPGITGWDTVRVLAADESFGLPILIHPALLGGWLQSDDNDDGDDECQHHPRGLSHKFLFGILPRLVGGDAVIFPNAGGRFQFTAQECLAVADGCRFPMGRFKSILPSPAGGMKLHRVQEMREQFGDDTLFLIGGALLEQGPDLYKDAQEFAHCAGRDRPYVPTKQLTQAGASATNPTDTTGPTIGEVQQVANAVRRRVLQYTIENNGGYLSQACSAAEALATLYMRALNLGPSISPLVPGPFRGSPGPGIPAVTGEGHNGDFTDPKLDRIIFSPVHYALVLYSLLVEVGRLSVEAFESYNKDGSTVELIGAEHSPGHAVTAGSLAQALSQASGIAYARKRKGHTGRVIVYMSDGELQEGQAWEAVQGLVFHKIGSVTAVVDVNGQQCDGAMKSVCDVGNLAQKLKAFGAKVFRVDGHDIAGIERAVKSHNPDTPTFVLCYTDPCRGFPALRELAPKLHYVRFKNEAEKQKWRDILNQMDDDNTTIESKDSTGATSDSTNENTRPRSETEQDESNKKAKVSGEAITESMVVDGNDTQEDCTDCKLIEMVTRPHRSNLLEWSKRHPLAITLTADLTSSCEADLLRDSLPEQYLSMGMAEQHMMSFAGGMAREGLHPYIQTFAVFVTRRPYDQVAMSIAVPNLPVRLLGFLPGVMTPGGVTHQAIDDVALMRSMPNMRILEVGDATEVESVLDVAEAIDGPVYIRMLRGEVPRLFPKSSPMKFGVVRTLSEGTDIAVITTGICTEQALKARSMLESSGVSILHLHLSTIVPFPNEAILKAAGQVKHGIITMENHSVIGGVGSAVAEVLAEQGIGKRLIRLGVPGVYAHGASCAYLMDEYGIDARALIGAIEKFVGKTLLVADGSGSYEDSRKAATASNVVLAEERPEDL